MAPQQERREKDNWNRHERITSPPTHQGNENLTPRILYVTVGTNLKRKKSRKMLRKRIGQGIL